MQPLSDSLILLKMELDNLNNLHGVSLNSILEKLKPISDITTKFDELWLGAWGRDDFNHYTDFNNKNRDIEVPKEYFIGIIERKHAINLINIQKQIADGLEEYKKFQKHIVTELSIIRDDENYKNENELLISLEKFKWGYETEDINKFQMPKQIPIYDYDILSRGIPVPPHIYTGSLITSLMTKSSSVKGFSELVNRILRQIEIKTAREIPTETSEHTDKILKDIFSNFHIFYSQLKDRYNNRVSIEINDEYDVQDLLHAILKLHFQDVRKEEYTPSYAGSSTRMDFLLKIESIVIEVKRTRERLSDKEIGEQLILDVAHYKNHPGCLSLKCFVYDPENRIKNPRGLENDLRRLSDENMSVELHICP